MKNNKLLILTLLLVLLTTSLVFAEENPMDNLEVNQERAKILSVEEIELDEEELGIIGKQLVQLEVLTGEYKGEKLEIENDLSGHPSYDIVVSQGDKVIIGIETMDGELGEVYITDFSRQEYIILLGGVFLILILVIGGEKGFKAILTLILTLLLIFKLLLPLTIKGYNPIPISTIIAILITFLTMLVIGGVNYKSISASIGTSLGVFIAGLLAYIIGSKAKLTGLSAEEAVSLTYLIKDINMQNLLFAGILLGSLGAVMDVGMSIASSIQEIYTANNEIGQKELFKSGMNVGKDIMGTMTNTLILAYMGSSIPLLLVLMSYEPNFVKIINLDIIATEIIRSLSGSIGLVLTIPITALISSILIKKKS